MVYTERGNACSEVGMNGIDTMDTGVEFKVVSLAFWKDFGCQKDGKVIKYH